MFPFESKQTTFGLPGIPYDKKKQRYMTEDELDRIKKYQQPTNNVPKIVYDEEEERYIAKAVSSNKYIIPTDINLAQQIVQLLPEELLTPETKFLDPFCKTGAFLRALKKRLFWSKAMIEAFPDYVDRVHHMEKNQLYGLCINEQSLEASKNIVYARPYDLGIREVPGLLSIIKDKERFREVIRKEFGDMKFDVILGNPPYNRGMDLDFVNQSFDISNRYCLFITPAKWQTADSDQSVSSKTTNYGGFRSKIVPHMSKAVFYPNCSDLFEINERSGISYYLIDKNNIYDKKEIVNICKNQKYFNSVETRSLSNRESLHNIGNEIINYLKPYDSFGFRVDSSKRYHVYVNSQLNPERGKEGTWQAYGIISYKTGQSNVLGASEIIDSTDQIAMESRVTASTLAFTSDSIAECNSFLSYVYTKFVRFFVLMNISKMTGIDDDVFRFVPSPPVDENGDYIWKYNYTDTSLYKFYGLDRPDAQTSNGVRYTDIIESVIKERK